MTKPRRLKSPVAMILLLALVCCVSKVTLDRATHDLGWPDEWIYLTLARSIVEKGSLNTNFYIASSIDLIGYPHRDVHLPGYALTLAALGSVRGYTFNTAAGINVLCFVLSTMSVFLLARRFLSVERSFAAAALAALLPPYAGYLAIVYPEHVTAAALLTLLAAAAWVRGRLATFAVGFLLGTSLLFRETLLFALPSFVHLIGKRKSARFLIPGMLLAMLVVLPPLAAHRAVHPNALYPSAVTEALKSPEPITQLTNTIVANAQINLELLFSSNPFARAEDAVLVFILALALLSLIACARLDRATRSFALATVLSTCLLFAAMIVIYVVRERGGVWGGIRALMPMVPLFIISLCGVNLSRSVAGLLLGAVISLGVYLDSWQINYFNRVKGSSLEDQDRAATFIEARTRKFAPRRVVGGRYFQYAYRNFPVEVVWSGADDVADLDRLYPKFAFDFVVINRRSPTRFDLRKDPRYEWVNADEGQAAEYQIYRRIAP